MFYDENVLALNHYNMISRLLCNDKPVLNPDSKLIDYAEIYRTC